MEKLPEGELVLVKQSGAGREEGNCDCPAEQFAMWSRADKVKDVNSVLMQAAKRVDQVSGTEVLS